MMNIRQHLIPLLGAFWGLTLLLAACGKEKADQPLSITIEASSQELTLTFDEGTYSSGTVQAANGQYTFLYKPQTGATVFVLTYPDGVVFHQTIEQNGSIQTSLTYDSSERIDKGYVDMFSMEWAISDVVKAAPGGRRGNNGPSPLLAIFFLCCGVFFLFVPKTAWQFSHGWWYKDAEPSDAALTLYGVLGAGILFAGIVCLLASF